MGIHLKCLEMFKEIYLVARFGLRLLPKLFGNFGDFANSRTQKSCVCVSDTQALHLQASKEAIVSYAHPLFVGGWGFRFSGLIFGRSGFSHKTLPEAQRTQGIESIT